MANEFYKTAMGRELYALTLPKLIWALEHVGAQLEKLAKQREAETSSGPDELHERG